MSFPKTSAFLVEKGISSEETMDKLRSYCDGLLVANAQFNLTAITDPDGIDSKHLLDSLAGYDFVKDAKTVCDIGSGAGFPGVPLAAVCPATSFSLVDSLRKRVDFINTCTKKSQILNCVAYHMRAEEFCAAHREEFDVCTARAVARLNTLAELCAPLVKVGGLFVAYKGKSVDEELEEAKNALDTLGLKMKELRGYGIGDDETHYLAVFEKVRPTPARFPRSGNKPRTRPLI